MKKLTTIILLAAMFLNLFAFAAFAETSNNARASNYFDYYGVRLSDTGNGRVKIVFSVGGTGVCNSIGVANYQVERKNNSGNWEDVTGLLSGKTSSGVSSYTFSKYFYGDEDETYRVKAVFICTIGTGSETKSYTSGSVNT